MLEKVSLNICFMMKSKAFVAFLSVCINFEDTVTAAANEKYFGKAHYSNTKSHIIWPIALNTTVAWNSNGFE